MLKLWVCVTLFGIIMLWHQVYCAMTEAQIKSAVKLARRSCQGKTKATNEQIDGMHKGNWDIDHTTMCYLNCALAMYKLQRADNTFNLEASAAQLKQLPESLREASAKTTESCKDSAKTLDDKCVAAYEIAKCLYDADPEKYFLP
uniref:Odorant-binding protein 16 n=1 Tax=Dastarcus helophoroides TaxID=1169899 RepID=A0A1I9HZR0_9CUCU|nr:odorant-binding protein 16 [Dastarcus helophoroides]